jgi:hypothetical protein
MVLAAGPVVCVEGRRFLYLVAAPLVYRLLVEA